MVGQKHRGDRKPHTDIILWRFGKGKDGNKDKNMKRIIAIVCLAIAITTNAMAQQAKDVTNNQSNMKSFKSTAWLLPQPVLIIGTYDKEGKPNAMNAAWGGQWDMHEIIISHSTTFLLQTLRSHPIQNTHIRRRKYLVIYLFIINAMFIILKLQSGFTP